MRILMVLGLIVFVFVLAGVLWLWPLHEVQSDTVTQSPIVNVVVAASSSPVDERTQQLAREVAGKGWIAYGARSENGTWDLFLSRPDGSQRRNITQTADYEEAAPRFSNDGKKMLYRRCAKETKFNHDLWGFEGEVVMANWDGSQPVVFGKDREYSWACWSPDAKQISCLTRREIQIVDMESKKVVNTMPRQGIYQQLFWSSDGKWFTGTGNHEGMQWCVVRLNAETGELNAAYKYQSCTPDWCPDAQHIIYSSRPPNQSPNNEYGWTQLWMVNGDGQNPQLLYGEDGVHIYGGAMSPDGAYVLFTRCPQDGGGSESTGAPICIMRTADAPTIGGTSADLRKIHPQTKDGPVLVLENGWEPAWTYAE